MLPYVEAILNGWRGGKSAVGLSRSHRKRTPRVWERHPRNGIRGVDFCAKMEVCRSVEKEGGVHCIGEVPAGEVIVPTVGLLQVAGLRREGEMHQDLSGQASPIVRWRRKTFPWKPAKSSFVE